MAKREKKPVHHVQMTDGKRAIIQHLIQEMMEAEMDDHLGYGLSERLDRSEQTDYRNGTKQKQVNTRIHDHRCPAGSQLYL